MGEVYRASHRLLARPAAIKLIRPEAISGDRAAAEVAIARFRREAEVAATLRSPHTVELYDFGVTDDRTFYLVMELLEGLDLDELVRATGPMPPGRVVHVLRQVCDSLEEAHGLGLVHRDIKPANLHVGRRPRHDFVKVLDFGLVKSIAGGAEHTLASGPTATPGTPAYMAPEVALGRSVDARTDLYAVGCVAFYALTGELVFESKTAVEMIAKHLHEEPVPPSLRAPAEIPPALDELVLACLAKDPQRRPSSAAALARSLAAVDVTWTEEQAADWWRARL
jgi:eukaryotic-like serine/threonine-protein kinase